MFKRVREISDMVNIWYTEETTKMVRIWNTLSKKLYIRLIVCYFT